MKGSLVLWTAFIIGTCSASVQGSPESFKLSVQITEKSKLQCTENNFLLEETSFVKSATEVNEDAMLDSMVDCNSVSAKQSGCLLGAEETLNAFAHNDVAFLFIAPNIRYCVEVYKGNQSSAQPTFVKEFRSNQAIGETIVHNDETYILVETWTFLGFVRKQFLQEIPPVYHYSPCLRDESYNAYHSVAVEVQHEQESMIMDTIAECINGKSDLCTLGAESTINAFLEGELMVLVVSEKAAIFTLEYISTKTGNVVTRHQSFLQANFQYNIVVGKELYILKRCILFLRYTQDIQINHTLIIKKSRCVRGLRDHHFDYGFGGMSGILLGSSQSSSPATDTEETNTSQNAGLLITTVKPKVIERCNKTEALQQKLKVFGIQLGSSSIIAMFLLLFVVVVLQAAFIYYRIRA